VLNRCIKKTNIVIRFRENAK